jgi:toxin ParE1/3/4
VSIRWSETAAGQLQAIRDYVARSSPSYGQALAERIVRKVEVLNDQPLSGAEVPEYSDEALRELFEHPYRILYRVVGDDVEVVAIIHASRRLPRTPPG